VGAGPAIAEAEQALDRQAGGLDAPASAIQVDDVREGECLGIEDDGEGGAPGGADPDLDQAGTVAAAVGAVPPEPDDAVAGEQAGQPLPRRHPPPDQRHQHR